MRRTVLFLVPILVLSAVVAFGVARFKEHNYVAFQAGLAIPSGATATVESGGTLTIASGATLTQAGVDLTAELAALNGIDATEAGYLNGSGTTVVASKAVISDGDKDIVGLRQLWLGTNGAAGFAGVINIQDGANPGSTAAIAYADLALIDGITAGTTAASKAVTAGADGAVGATTFDGDITVSAEATGGNAGAKNEVIGLPRIALVALGAGTNGAAAGKTLALMDDTPDGEWAAHDAQTTVTADATYYRTGTKSLGILFGTSAVAGNGAHDGVTYDFSDDESVGLYMMCDSTLSAGDLVLDLTDNGGNHAINLPAVAAANVWQWVDLTTGITALANVDKDVITDISIELSAAGAAVVAGGAVQCYFDTMFKWDATEEEALGKAIVQDGVLSVVDTAGTVATRSTSTLVEGTDYFVHYETGNDFIVWITDQSAATPVALVAY